jgi:hypothetical protein
VIETRTTLSVVRDLERLIQDWKRCDLTSDQFSVQLAHASRDFNAAYDREEGE